MEIRVFPDGAAVADAAARSMARRLNAAVHRRGRATVAVSGGRTPAEMFARLATMAVSWDDVEVWQVDERVAPDGDPARNLGLLSALPVPPERIHPMPVTAPDLARAAADYAAGLPAAFDVVHLGLGDDGHTASWPPADPVIDEAEAVALSGRFDGYVRMTLTPVTVNAARTRMVVLAGEAKAAPLLGWVLQRDLPISRVRTVATTVFADAAACARLPEFAADPR